MNQQDIIIYMNSQRYMDCCKEYEGKYKDLSDIFMLYSGSFEKQFCETIKNANRIEYSIGGETLLYGYYYPGIHDMVVDGMKRGRLVKKSAKRSTYKYYFCNSKLIALEKNGDNIVEKAFFLEDAENIFGIMFNNEENAIVTKCNYLNGKKHSFAYASVDTLFLNDRLYEEEIYEYDKDGILCGAITNEYICSNNSLLRRTKYEFFHDDANCIFKYNARVYIGEIECKNLRIIGGKTLVRQRF